MNTAQTAAALWQTYSTMSAGGVIVGIGLYDGDDCLIDLQGDKFKAPAACDASLAKLQAICETLNVAAATPDARAVLVRILDAVNAHDAELDDTANGGENARPPEGDDYNAIVGLVRHECALYLDGHARRETKTAGPAPIAAALPILRDAIATYRGAGNFYYLENGALLSGPINKDGSYAWGDVCEVDRAFLGADCLEPEAAAECQRALAALRAVSCTAKPAA